MDQRDRELDALLEPLRGGEPAQREIHQWQTVMAHQNLERPGLRVWGPLLAACIVGAMFGVSGTFALYQKTYENKCGDEHTRKKFEAYATTEVTHIKLD